MGEHLRGKHSDELQVVEAISTTDNKLKNARVMRLRTLGNHTHNLQVLRKGTSTHHGLTPTST